jgi:hypothetical protein
MIPGRARARPRLLRSILDSSIAWPRGKTAACVDGRLPTRGYLLHLRDIHAEASRDLAGPRVGHFQSFLQSPCLGHLRRTVSSLANPASLVTICTDYFPKMLRSSKFCALFVSPNTCRG